MAYETCLTEIKKAAGVDFTDKELTRILTDILDRKAASKSPRLAASDPAAALKAAAVELSDEARMAAAIEKRNSLLNLQARVARRNRILAAPNPIDGIKAEIHGINTPTKGGRFSAEAQSKALAKQYTAGAINELEKAGLFETVRDGHLERQWAKELFELSKGKDGNPGVTKSKEALEIATIFHKYQTLAKNDVNAAGGWIGDYSGYITRTAHDADKIRQAGFDAWSRSIMEKLDQARTFEGVEDRQKFLRGAWKGLVTGLHLTHDGVQGMKDPAFVGPGNLAKRVSEERVLHFKDADAWLDYHKDFARGSVLETLNRSLEQSARSTALMKVYGTNPRAEFGADLRHLEQRYQQAGELDKVTALREAEKSLQNRFDYLDGTANMPVNRLGAKIGSATRVIQSMAKLGGVVFTHLSVGTTKAAELRYQGVGLLQGYGDFAASVFRGRGAGETRAIMDRLLAGYEGMQRDILSRFEPDDGVPGTLSKTANTYFKWTGLTYMLNAQRAGAEFVMARHLGDMLERGFGELPPETTRILNMFGIDGQHWEHLRDVPDHADIDGRRFLTPDAAKRIDPASVAERLRREGAIGDKATPATIDRKVNAYRDDLALRLHSYFNDRSEFTVIVPGINEKAMLLRGTRPGTWEGEALRAIMQFKTWPAAVISKAWGREIYGGQSKAAAIGGILHMAVGGTVLGYLAMSLKDLFKGREPRDPTSPATWAAAMIQGGGAGIFGDYLFGEYSRYGNSLLGAALGPTIGQAETVFDLYNRIKRKAAGEPGSDVGAQAFRAVLGNVPFVNLFYTRIALDYLFLYQVQEALNPGFLRRFQDQVKKQNHQDFWLAPSQSIGRAPARAIVHPLGG